MLFESEWALEYAQRNNPDVQFHAVHAARQQVQRSALKQKKGPEAFASGPNSILKSQT